LFVTSSRCYSPTVVRRREKVERKSIAVQFEDSFVEQRIAEERHQRKTKMKLARKEIAGSQLQQLIVVV
jgi:hypothetical protein